MSAPLQRESASHNLPQRNAMDAHNRAQVQQMRTQLVTLEALKAEAIAKDNPSMALAYERKITNQKNLLNEARMDAGDPRETVAKQRSGKGFLFFDGGV